MNSSPTLKHPTCGASSSTRALALSKLSTSKATIILSFGSICASLRYEIVRCFPQKYITSDRGEKQEPLCTGLVNNGHGKGGKKGIVISAKTYISLGSIKKLMPK